MSETYKSETLEHFGLVAGMFDEAWVMSVPGTLKEAEELLADADPKTMHSLTEGYRYTPVKSHDAGVEQRWLVKARTRALKRVDKKLLKQSEQEQKAFEKLCRTRFNCPEDAERALVQTQLNLLPRDVLWQSVTLSRQCSGHTSRFPHRNSIARNTVT